MKARVFISCGQENSDEREIAGNVAKALQELGYEPYIAVVEQTLSGLKENILKRLDECEYYLFLDFRRELLGNREPKCYRGSLFSHQELAIAAFLNKEVIAFQETEVVKHEGVLGILQANATEFHDRKDLPSLVAKAVSERWNPNWHDTLMIERDVSQCADELHPGPQGPRPVRYYHVQVTNKHLRRTAFGCYAYLEDMRDAVADKKIETKFVEYKWRGVPFPA